MNRLFFGGIIFLVCGCHCFNGTTMLGRPIQVVEKVYQDGWKVYGRVMISKDGVYQWAQTDVWNPSSEDVVSAGQLPEKLLKELASSSHESQGWQSVNGVLTFEYAVDDTKTPYPQSLKDLFIFLYGTRTVSVRSRTP